jgi:hypothetical protein
LTPSVNRSTHPPIIGDSSAILRSPVTADRRTAHRKSERRRDDPVAGGLRKGALRSKLFRSAKRVHRPDDRAHETQSKIWSQNVQPRFQTSAAVEIAEHVSGGFISVRNRIDSLIYHVITVVIVQVRDVMALMRIEHVICDEQADYSAQKKYERLASDASFDCRCHQRSRFCGAF